MSGENGQACADAVRLVGREGLPPQPPTISSPLNAEIDLGDALSYTITADGEPPITYAAIDLPDGCSFDGVDAISGTPTAGGTTDITLTATNPYGSHQQTLVLSVNAPPPPIADAGPSQTVEVGQTVTLDGSGSRHAAPVVNVALAANGATIAGTNGGAWGALIDGNTTDYTAYSGYGYTYWTSSPPGSMTVRLADSHPLTKIRVKLWDRDARYYRYRVEVAANAAGPWQQVVDRTAGQHRGWCEDTFPPVDAQHIRITGTRNSANAGFHVVELEAYAEPPLTYVWSQVAGTPVALSDDTSAKPTFQAAQPGACAFQLVVHDGIQPSAPDRVEITATGVALVGAPPTEGADDADGIEVLVAPTQGPAPLAIDGLVLGAKPGASCTWVFGDGASAAGRTVSHVYHSPGQYTITVKVDGQVLRVAVVAE